MKPQPLLKANILEVIPTRGGWVNAHGHFDRAYTVTPELLHQSHALLENKWALVDSMKKESSEEDYYKRIEQSVKMLIAQQVTACATFIDVDSLSELRALKAAVAIRTKYKDQITIKLINQTLKGLIDPIESQWAEKSLEYVDIIGALPSKDRPNESSHFDRVFSWAHETGKMVHVHIDQENNPDEHDTELLIKKTKQHHLEAKIVAIHAISIAAHAKQEREEIYQGLKDAGISIVCCPSAALSMKQLDKQSGLHNSIAPVVELLEHGIPVALGVDNISDIYQPLVDGDMYTELRMLAESSRFYKIESLVDIATKFGRMALGVAL